MNIKKVGLGFFGLLLSLFMVSQSAFALVPSYDNTKQRLITDTDNQGGSPLFNPGSLGISADKSLSENISTIFSPDNDSSTLLVLMRTIMIGVLVLYFAWIGIDLMLNPNDAGKNKAARKSILYVVLGAGLIRGSTRVLGRGLGISDLGGGTSASGEGVNRLINIVLFQVLTFLRAFAFFYAIIIVMRYGFNMIRALDKEDVIKNAKKGLLNVILAVIFIKIVDFIFFIAQDVNFTSQAKRFMFDLAKGVGYIIGIGIVLTILFTGFKLITAQGDDAKIKDAKNTLSTVFFIVLTIIMFLLVTRQIIDVFA